MKLFRITLYLIALSFFLLACQSIRTSTKRHSPETTIEIEKENQKVSVFYNRPYKKSRLIFGTKEEEALVPYGKKWRTGANEATEITLSTDATIQGKKLTAGTYSLYTIPGPEKWIIAFNSRTDYWGATLGSPFKEKSDVLRVEVPVQKLDKVVEQFTIKLDEGNGSIILSLLWDQVLVGLEIE